MATQKEKYRRPYDYKTAGEKGLLSVNGDGSSTESLFMTVGYNYEFGFMTLSDDMTFASDTSIVRDQNIFIADTGAMSDTTRFLDGLKNVEEASKEYAITDAYGTNIIASKHGTLKGVIYDKQCRDLHVVAIYGVLHMPRSELNLFSVSIRTEEVWKLGGDKTAI